MRPLPGLEPVGHSGYGKEAEKAWQRTLIDPKDGLLPLLRWRTQHIYPLRTEHGFRSGCTAKGWPDVVALRQQWVVALEIKGYDAKGRPTPFQPGQVEWLEAFEQIPTGRAWVLRPTDDWPMVIDFFRHPENAPQRFGWSDADRR